MDPSIATTPRASPRENRRPEPRRQDRDDPPFAERRLGQDVAARIGSTVQSVDVTHVGFLFVALALIVYVFSDPSRSGFYNHFVWQADAFLHGRFAIAWPVESGPYTNAYFQDVMPLPSDSGSSYGLLPFPPLPAVVLLPFVTIFGLATDSQLVGAALGAVNVGLAWRLTTRLSDDRAAALLATIFFAFGTVHWYAAMLSTTWFLAHIVAVTFVLLGVTLAIDAERRWQSLRRMNRLADTPDRSPDTVSEPFVESNMFVEWGRRIRQNVDPAQFMAGFVFGLGALARLPVILGAPFFVFVGGGGSYTRRAVSAGLGAALPLALLLLYNVAATGHVFNPAYEHLYQTEYLGYLPPEHCLFPADLCANLRIDRSLGIEDIGHVPLNTLIMLGWPPEFFPKGTECGVGLLNRDCPVVVPSQIGMSILLTSPAYLLAFSMAIAGWRRRIVAGSALAIVAIAFVNLLHFSQGWVQFGYRFSNDFAPFALILVTLAITRLHGLWRALAVALVVASIIINAWGVYWGVTLGW